MGIQQESAELAAVVEETVAGVRVVKGFGAEAVQAGRLRAEADDVYGRSMEAAGVRATFLPALELLPNIGLIATLGYGGHQVLDGQLTLGELVAFNVYVVMLIWPLRMLGMIIAQAQRAAAAAERVHEVLATAPVIVDAPHGTPPARSPRRGVGARCASTSVRFAYAPELPVVLDGFDLVVPAGQSVALVGATGSGKTTVARLIPRFYDVVDGRVVVDGVDVRDVRLARAAQGGGHRVRGHLPLLRQHRRQHRLRRPRRGPEAIARAARLAGAHEFIEALPEGYDTRSASGASPSRAGSASASPSPGPSWPTPGCSSSTTPPPRSTPPRSTRSATPWPR